MVVASLTDILQECKIAPLYIYDIHRPVGLPAGFFFVVGQNIQT